MNEYKDNEKCMAAYHEALDHSRHIIEDAFGRCRLINHMVKISEPAIEEDEQANMIMIRTYLDCLTEDLRNFLAKDIL